MKLAMMGKIFSRFRFLDVNYGLFLDSYFDAAGESHDPPSKEEQFLVEHNKQYYGKLTTKKLYLDVF